MTLLIGYALVLAGFIMGFFLAALLAAAGKDQ